MVLYHQALFVIKGKLSASRYNILSFVIWGDIQSPQVFKIKKLWQNFRQKFHFWYFRSLNFSKKKKKKKEREKEKVVLFCFVLFLPFLLKLPNFIFWSCHHHLIMCLNTVSDHTSWSCKLASLFKQEKNRMKKSFF